MTTDLIKIESILRDYNGDESMLIQALLRIQKECGWLPKDGLFEVSRALGVPLNRVYHVATFYKSFSLVPRGKHTINLCMGTACHVRGAPRILERFEQILEINAGETTPDLKFSLETVNCLGCCALGPVLVVDGQYHGKFKVSDVEKLLASYEEK